MPKDPLHEEMLVNAIRHWAEAEDGRVRDGELPADVAVRLFDLAVMDGVELEEIISKAIDGSKQKSITIEQAAKLIIKTLTKSGYFE